MTPRRSWFLCHTPRSGSTLLCTLMASSGVAGQPQSWFRSQNRAEWAADWGIARPDESYDWQDYLSAAIRAGLGPNGICAQRFNWDSFSDTTRDLGTDSRAGLEAIFGPITWVHLTRGDLVAQAVSWMRAEQSGTWHLDFEEAEHPVPPHYDASMIRRFIAEAEAGNRAWRDWFAAQGITPIPLTYEAMARDPIGTAQGLLAALGLVATAPITIGNRKMADAESLAWVRRYRDETGLEDQVG